jgi:hypothetical protein
MTEKQRWLVNDLDAWRDRAVAKIGKYGPLKEPKMPAKVRAAKRAEAIAALEIQRWEASKREPWQKQKDAIAKQYNEVRRIVLFEKTETALKAIRALVKRGAA